MMIGTFPIDMVESGAFADGASQCMMERSREVILKRVTDVMQIYLGFQELNVTF